MIIDTQGFDQPIDAGGESRELAEEIESII
jgi:hypothetical protein